MDDKPVDDTGLVPQDAAASGVGMPGFWADRAAGDATVPSGPRCPVCATPLANSGSGWVCTRPGCREAALPPTAAHAPGPPPPAVRSSNRGPSTIGWLVTAGVLVAASLVVLALRPGEGEAVPSPSSSPTPSPATSQPSPATPSPVAPSPTQSDLDPPLMTGTIRVGERPVAIALEPDAGLGFTANFDGGDVSVIDLAAGVVVDTLPVPGRPAAIAVDSDGLVYVADGSASRVYVIDIATGERVSSFKTGGRPRALAVDAERHVGYVGVARGVEVVDLETGALMDSLAADTPVDLVVDAETHQLWVLWSDAVGTWDPVTEAWTSPSYGDDAVTGLDVDGRRQRLYLAGEQLREWDLTAGTVREFAVDAPGHTVRVDPNSRIAYLVDPAANAITALSVG